MCLSGDNFLPVISSSIMNSAGINIIAWSGGISRMNCNVSFGTTSLSTLSANAISISPDGLSFAFVGSGGFYINTSFTQVTTSTYTLKALPTGDVYTNVVHCGNTIFIQSSTKIYSTVDLGTTWVEYYVGFPRTIAASNDGKYLYILTKGGDIVTKRTSVVKYAIGSKLSSFTAGPIPFLITQSIETGTSLLNIPAGIWGISMGFSFLPSSATGERAISNVVYGLSTTQYGFDLIKQNRRYNITFGTPLTYESYADNTIVVFTKPTSLFLDAFINNVSGSTGNRMTNCFINATMLNGISSVIL